MSHLLATTDGPADAELISAVRGGDLEAYGELFSRHVDAARRLARQLAPGGDADDLVSEAFSKVLGVLQRGGGPDVSFRAYLLTSVRRLRVDMLRSAGRVQPADDLGEHDPGVPFSDTVVAHFESSAAARAFASLPERWQMVLWHTEVEGQKPAEVAPLLGMSPNSVSALAYRAREGLRQAFLTEHAQSLESDTCRWTHAQLGAYVRGGVSRRDGAKVEEHLTGCRPCAAVYLELTEVNAGLAGLIAPLLLAGSAPAYVAAAGSTHAAGWLLLLGRGREWVGGHSAGAAVGVAGVAGVAVVVAGGLTLLADNPAPTRPGATGPATSSSPPPAAAPSGSATPDDAGRPPTVRAAPALRSAPATEDAPAATNVPAAGPPATTTAPGAPPTRSPVSAPTRSTAPARAPGPAPAPAPTSDPPPTRTPPPDPAAEPTVSLTATVEARGAMRFTVTVTVSGLEGPAVLTVSGRGLEFLHSREPCSDDALTSRCELAGDGSVELLAEAVDAGGSLALLLADDRGTLAEGSVALGGGRHPPARHPGR